MIPPPNVWSRGILLWTRADSTDTVGRHTLQLPLCYGWIASVCSVHHLGASLSECFPHILEEAHRVAFLWELLIDVPQAIRAMSKTYRPFEPAQMFLLSPSFIASETEQITAYSDTPPNLDPASTSLACSADTVPSRSPEYHDHSSMPVHIQWPPPTTVQRWSSVIS